MFNVFNPGLKVIIIKNYCCFYHNRVNYSGLMTILKYIYGGIAYVESDLAVIWWV